MTSHGRALLLAVAALLLLGGLLDGLRGRDYPAYPDRIDCGSVLAPTTFIVSDPGDPLVDEAARCAGAMASAAPRAWTMLGGAGLLVVVAAASLAGPAPVRRRPVGADDTFG